MIENGGLVDRRIWNVTGLLLGAAAAAATVVAGCDSGWRIGAPWIVTLPLALLYAVEIMLATNLLSEVEIRLSNLSVVAALLALGPFAAMLTVWAGTAIAEIIQTLQTRATHIGPRRSPYQALTIALQGVACSIAIIWVGNLVFTSVDRELIPFLITPFPTLSLSLLLLTTGALSLFALFWRLILVTREPTRFLRQHLSSLLHHIVIGPIVGVLLADEYRAMHLQEAIILTIVIALLFMMIRRARRTRTTLERRIKQLGVLGDISHQLSISLDLDEVLDAIYQEVSRLLEASEFYLALYDEQSEIIDFSLIVREGERIPSQRRAMGHGLTDYIIRSRRPLLLSGDVEAQVKQMGLKIIGPIPLSYMATPILVGKDMLGVISIQHYGKATAYSAADASLLETLAAQAATALQNARLYQRISRQAKHLASLNKAFTLMGSSLDPDEVIERVCELAMEVMGAQKAAVFMLTEGGSRVRMVSSLGLTDEYVASSQNIEPGVGPRTVVIVENRALAVSDVVAASNMEIILPLAEQEGFRALLEVPLHIERRVIGALAVYYEKPHVFEADEIELLTALGGQMAIAVENAHLFERASIELSHRVRELETIEAISREMTSQLNLETVMQRLIEAATAATEAEFVEIATLDEREEVLNSVAKKEDIELTYDDWPADRGITGRALRVGEAILVPDVRQDSDYVPGHPDTRSELVVPIIHGDRRLGVINLESTRHNAFTKEHKRFVTTLAKHAAVAIENARLFGNARQQVIELEALRSAATGLLVSPDVEQALAVIAEHALLLTDAQDIHIYLYDEETDILTFGASLWDNGDRNVEFAKPRPDGMTARVARSGRTIVIDDMATHPLFVQISEKTKDLRRRDGAIVGIPVTRGDRVIGAFNIAFHEPQRLSEQGLHVLELLAAQAAVAIDHARLAEQIRDAHDRLQAILDSTYDGILMFDNRLRLLLANPRSEYILSIRAEEHEGQTFLQIVEHLLQEYGPNALGYTLEDAAALMAEIQESPYRITRRRYEPDNPILRSVEEITTPVTGETGEIIGRLFVLRDFTQEVEIEEYREELSGMIVHDLRSPLSGVLTSLHFAMTELQGKMPDLESIEASLNIAFNCAENQLQLIETLIEINKLSSGELLTELGEVNVELLAQEAMSIFRDLAREVDISFRVTSPSDIHTLNADEATIRRVLVNLLDNAMNFTPEGGEVRIDIRSYPTHQQITVTDTGPGIPETDRDRIFERFVQLDKRKRVRGSKGSGLGLTFCRLAVEAHGGRIWADSGPEGGAAFHFTLPTNLYPLPN